MNIVRSNFVIWWNDTVKIVIGQFHISQLGYWLEYFLRYPDAEEFHSLIQTQNWQKPLLFYVTLMVVVVSDIDIYIIKNL